MNIYRCIYFYAYNLEPVVGLYHFITLFIIHSGVWVDLNLNLSINMITLLFNLFLEVFFYN